MNLYYDCLIGTWAGGILWVRSKTDKPMQAYFSQAREKTGRQVKMLDFLPPLLIAKMCYFCLEDCCLGTQCSQVLGPRVGKVIRHVSFTRERDCNVDQPRMRKLLGHGARA